MLQRQRPDERSNILWISIDSLRSDHCSMLGYERSTTPFLKSLAEDAFVFTAARSPSTASFYSIMSMLSGAYPSTIASRGGEDPPFLSSQLRDAGYDTAAYYWRDIFSMRDQNWPKPNKSLGFETVNAGLGAADEILPELASFIGRRREGPYFAFAHLMDPHWPYLLRPGFDFGGEPIDRYDSEIAYVDAKLRDFFSKLEANNQLANTIVVISSDHGEAFGEHGATYHGGRPMEVECRVPLLLRVPYLESRQGRSDAPVTLSSVARSLCELVDVPAPPLAEGESLVPWLCGVDDEDETYAVVELPAFSQLPGLGVYRVVATRRWKLIENLREDLQMLFRIDEDPDENQDLALNESNQIAAMQELAQEWRNDLAARRDEEDAGGLSHAHPGTRRQVAGSPRRVAPLPSRQRSQPTPSERRAALQPRPREG